MKKVRILEDINRYFALQAPLAEPTLQNFNNPKGVETWTFSLDGVPTERMIVYLRSDVGCEFGTRAGGCTGCRHWRLGTAGRSLGFKDMYVKQFESAVQSFGYRPVMCLYNEGNMLNERELPLEQLICIIKKMRDNGVQRLILESRPEYITDRVLSPIREAAGDQMTIEVGIGLESSNDVIRNELFLKATTLKAYEKAVKRLRKHGCLSLAYVIQKPAFLNEAQGIADTVRTISYAFSVGTDIVSIEPIGVERFTITDHLYRLGYFKPTWLWSVINVVKQTHSLGEIRIGGYQYEPRPEILPKNCDNCTDDFIDAINKFNLTYDIEILNALECKSCFDEYSDFLNSQSDLIDEVELTKNIQKFADEVMNIIPDSPGIDFRNRGSLLQVVGLDP